MTDTNRRRCEAVHSTSNLNRYRPIYDNILHCQIGLRRQSILHPGRSRSCLTRQGPRSGRFVNGRPCQDDGLLQHVVIDRSVRVPKILMLTKNRGRVRRTSAGNAVRLIAPGSKPERSFANSCSDIAPFALRLLSFRISSAELRPTIRRNSSRTARPRAS
jgi:hypothetical protein